MGGFFTKLRNLFTGFKKERKVLMVGLDAAGKTTILEYLKFNVVATTIPTVGFNVEEIKFGKLTMTIWDIGGQDKIRMLWRHYYEGNHGIIFVVDSSDHDRLELAKDELWKVLNAEECKNAALLVIANKQDLPGALPVSDLAGKLGLHSVKGRQWFIQGAVATRGEGLYDGLRELSKAIDKWAPRICFNLLNTHSFTSHPFNLFSISQSWNRLKGQK